MVDQHPRPAVLDKLEAIRGFTAELPRDRIRRQLCEVGAAIFAAGELAPADRKIYALRDVTATTESLPLIASSVMSKKIAEGTRTLVLDCKVGSGAFLNTEAESRELARTMVDLGTAPPQAITTGTTVSVILSPTPPVECLSTNASGLPSRD